MSLLFSLFGLVIVKLPFFNESSGLKVSELIVLIFSLESILIISFNIAASPSLELFNYSRHIINTF